MELHYKTILVALIAATFLPNVSPCEPPPPPEYESEWAENNEMCGTSTDNGKIVGGDDVSSIKDWPWLGLMVVAQRSNCTVELIAWEWATTAAHCVDGTTRPGDLTLTFGQVERNTPTSASRQRRVQRIVIHPLYSRVNGVHADLALLQLSSPLTYSSRIRSVCMQNDDFFDRIFNNCWVAGWGRLSTNGPIANRLQELQLTTVETDPSVCQELWDSPDGFWTETHLCATRPTGTGLCHGDSGGPLMCRYSDKQWVLLGITSFIGDGECGGDKPDGFTRVSPFRQWITDEINDHGGPK